MLHILPYINFFGWSVGGTVIGCRMMTDSIRHRFNNHRFIICQCKCTRLLCGIMNGKNIGAINTYCRYSVATWTSAGNSIAFVLFRAWRWYGKAIISTEISTIRFSFITRIIKNLIWFFFIENYKKFMKKKKNWKMEFAESSPKWHLPHQNRIIGQDSVAAKLKAAWASPSEAAPSPKYVITQRVLFERLFKAYAAPTACGIWVATRK